MKLYVVYWVDQDSFKIVAIFSNKIMASELVITGNSLPGVYGKYLISDDYTLDEPLVPPFHTR